MGIKVFVYEESIFTICRDLNKAYAMYNTKVKPKIELFCDKNNDVFVRFLLPISQDGDGVVQYIVRQGGVITMVGIDGQCFPRIEVHNDK